MRYLKLFRWIFWNAMACAFWALLIFEDHRRAIALVFLLPLQLGVNLVIYASLRQLRISGSTVIYGVGLIAGLAFVVRYHAWWAFVILIIPVGRVVWSIRKDRAKLLG
jgi:branched-subunit amino acid transport protein AzlD